MVCELCGKSAELISAEIESVELAVCAGCAKHGTMRKKSVQQSYVYSSPGKELPDVRIVPHFAYLIKTARERKNLNREDFARLLNEKESIVAKWEQGIVKPTIEAAQRLEQKLGVSLIEKEDAGSVEQPKRKLDDTLTLGDILMIKKREK